MAHDYQSFRDAGIILLMVSVDSLRRARQLAEQTKAPFPVLSDVNVDTTVAYDIFESGIAVPSSYIIDRDGIIRWKYIGTSPGDRPSTELLLEHAQTFSRAARSLIAHYDVCMDFLSYYVATYHEFVDVIAHMIRCMTKQGGHVANKCGRSQIFIA